LRFAVAVAFAVALTVAFLVVILRRTGSPMSALFAHWGRQAEDLLLLSQLSLLLSLFLLLSF
jgi:hypothetical protein